MELASRAPPSRNLSVDEEELKKFQFAFGYTKEDITFFLNPIIDSVWRFEEVVEAQKHMHNRKNRGKVLLDFSPLE